MIWTFIYGFRKEADLSVVIDSLDQFSRRYPFAWENEYFQSSYMLTLLGMAGAKYASDERKPGEEYLQRFEEMQAKWKGIEISEAVGNTYSLAVRSYVRVPDYTRARRVLQKGLEIAPFNIELNATKRTFGPSLGVE
jgi:hypothetical protein